MHLTFAFISTSSFTSIITILIFRCANPETEDYYIYFADQPTRNNCPDCPCNKKLSCLPSPYTTYIYNLYIPLYNRELQDIRFYLKTSIWWIGRSWIISHLTVSSIIIFEKTMTSTPSNIDISKNFKCKKSLRYIFISVYVLAFLFVSGLSVQIELK